MNCSADRQGHAAAGLADRAWHCLEHHHRRAAPELIHEIRYEVTDNETGALRAHWLRFAQQEVARQGKRVRIRDATVSWGFCYIAEREKFAAVVERLVKSLAAVGVSLRNPETDRITMVTDEGNQLYVTETQLLDAAIKRKHLTFQLWFSVEADVVCNVRRLSDEHVCHAYSLKGLKSNERDIVTRWSVEYFRLAVARPTDVWLIIDPTGETADVDWDEVVSETNVVPLYLPSVIGLPKRRLSKLSMPRGWSRVQINEHFLISHPDAFSSISVSTMVFESEHRDGMPTR